MTEKLKRCPFCGGEKLEFIDTGHSYVRCCECWCEAPTEVWNIRKPIDDIVKSLEIQADGYRENYPDDYIFEVYDMIDLCEEIIKNVKGGTE